MVEQRILNNWQDFRKVTRDRISPGRNLTNSQMKQAAEWMMEDEAYIEKHCADCGGPKTNPGADICLKCAKKKAASMGRTITPEQYRRG